MILIKPSHKILFISPKPLETIEAAGRTCYKSEDKITEGSAKIFTEMISKRGHLSVVEHPHMSVRFICDRGVSHEIVRHRLASYSQESTRYCNYKGGVTFIIPPWIRLPEGNYHEEDINDLFPEYCPEYDWFNAMLYAEVKYKILISEWSPQQARSVLPNSLKTEIVMTANLREWMHVFKLRCSKAAHPQMRELMCPLLEEVYTKIPTLFEGLINLCADLRGKRIENPEYDITNWSGDEKGEKL